MPNTSTPCGAQKTEWIGDAALRAFLGRYVQRVRPNESPSGLAFLVSAFTTNKVLGAFADSTGYAKGCNDMEKFFGELFEVNAYMACDLVCRELYDFCIRKKYAQRATARALQLQTNEGKFKPALCLCGSKNIRVWRLPQKIVCQDCGFTFTPEGKLNKDKLFQKWAEATAKTTPAVA